MQPSEDVRKESFASDKLMTEELASTVSKTETQLAKKGASHHRRTLLDTCEGTVFVVMNDRIRDWVADRAAGEGGSDACQ